MKSLKDGTKINSFTIKKILGSGGTGIVYLCNDRESQRECILKEVFPVDLAYRSNSSDKVYARSDRGDDFIKFLEITIERLKIIKNLNHSIVPKIYKIFQENNTLYTAMEYIEGVTLQDYIHENKILSEDAFKSIFFPILDGLKFIHDNGIIHNDLKPSNIILTSKRSLIVDFESSRSITNSRKISTLVVTDGYSPPEQYSSNGRVGPWSDIYSLGCTMYESISGEKMISAMDRLVEGEDDPLEPLSTKLKGKYDARILATIDKMIKIKIEERPQNISSVISELGGIELSVRTIIDIKVKDTSFDNEHNSYLAKSRLIQSDTKILRVKKEKKKQDNIFFQMLAIIGGVILASSIFSYFIDEPSFITKIVIYSTGAISGLLISRRN